MLSCFRRLIHCFYDDTNKILNDDSNTLITKNDNNKYIILNDNIYVECNICFEIIALQNMRMLYPCGHRLYCDLCIKDISKCPNCRGDIIEKKVIYENLTSND